MGDSGIVSLRGFLYQLKVFVYNIINNITNYAIIFEGKDDVEVSIDDSLFSHKIVISEKPQLIQVKNGTLNKTILSKIVLNWLKNGLGNKADYILVYSQQYEFDSAIEIVKHIIVTLKKQNATKKLRANSLFKIMYEMYLDSDSQFNEEKIRQDLTTIVESLLKNKTLLSVELIENTIFQTYTNKYCVDLNSQFAKEKRLAVVLTKIYQRTLDSIEKGRPYKIDFKDFMMIHTEAVIQVTDDVYQPDFPVFKKKATTIETVNKIFKAKKREVNQLLKIGLLESQVLNYLTYELFYRDIREAYMQTKIDQVEGLEATAFDIFLDEYTSVSVDKVNLFKNVMNKEPLKYKDIILDRFSNKGCYVYLTSDDAPLAYQITWSNQDE